LRGKVFVLGSGSWGIALSEVLAYNGYKVYSWHYNDKKSKKLNNSHIHHHLNYKINSKISFFSDLDLIDSSYPLIIALPSHLIHEVVSKIKDQRFKLVVSTSKGFVSGDYTISSMLVEKNYIKDTNIVCLTGPSHAEEVVKRKPTSIVASSKSITSAQDVQSMFACDYFRVYTNNDILGSEIGGAVKNVIAIAAGISIGFGIGDNAVSALLTRGLEEIKRLGVKLGAKRETFSGLSGLGDLIVTCYSEFSRNRKCGELIAKNYNIDMISSSIGMTIEGIYTCKNLFLLSKKLQVEMPIISETYKIIYQGKDPLESIKGLMTRELSSETFN